MSNLGPVSIQSTPLPGERLAPSTVSIPEEQPKRVGGVIGTLLCSYDSNSDWNTHHSYWHAEDQQYHNCKYADGFLLFEGVVSTKLENKKLFRIHELPEPRHHILRL